MRTGGKMAGMAEKRERAMTGAKMTARDLGEYRAELGKKGGLEKMTLERRSEQERAEAIKNQVLKDEAEYAAKLAREAQKKADQEKVEWHKQQVELRRKIKEERAKKEAEEAALAELKTTRLHQEVPPPKIVFIKPELGRPTPEQIQRRQEEHAALLKAAEEKADQIERAAVVKKVELPPPPPMQKLGFWGRLKQMWWEGREKPKK